MPDSTRLWHDSAARRRLLACLFPVLLGPMLLGPAVLGPAALVPTVAQADTAPPDTTLPATVSADALPTAQINGVVWTQVVVGDTVFVGGEFTKARPAGAPAGTQEVDRHNIMAYHLKTGVMTPFAHDLNAQVRSLVASPDGTILYAGGSFTTVDGVTRNRVAAFDVATGALTGFTPDVDGTVVGLAATPSVLYLVGAFGAVNDAQRSGVAAIALGTGAVTSFAPVATGGTARQVIVSPDQTRVVVGGSFTKMNGSSSPGYGLALLNASDGSLRPLPVNSVVRDANTNSAIMSLVSTAAGFYGSGYVYDSTAGDLEGSFKADWDGNLRWVEDCHGDTYSIFPSGTAVYVAGHPHYCGNVGGFPETLPRTYHRALAFSDAVRGTVSRNLYVGYSDFEGLPRPDLLVWRPDFNAGSYTGQTQGPWNVTGNTDYVVYGGEFTTVNEHDQQGLVRFARTGVVGNPHADGPRLSGPGLVPTGQSFAQGLRLSWPADYDRDNERLTYELIKNGNLLSPVFRRTALSTIWRRPNLAFLDTAVTVGQRYSYRLRVTDPDGNVVLGDPITATASGGKSLSSSDRAALSDGPQSYWTYDETSGSTAADLGSDGDAGSIGAGVTKGVSDGVPSDPATAFRFAGSYSGAVSTTVRRDAPQIFSLELWFRTSSRRGGKLIGFADRTVGRSVVYDRQLYLSNSGRLSFGVNPNDRRVITSADGYNNAQWHHAVATLSPQGQFLYVDGTQVASDTSTVTAQPSLGYWRVGGDALSSDWSHSGTRDYFHGDIDNPAVYPVALTSSQISAHYAARR